MPIRIAGGWQLPEVAKWWFHREENGGSNPPPPSHQKQQSWKKTKGKKDITFCIETFNDLEDTKVHIEGGTLDIMTIVGMALMRDEDLMDMFTAIVSASKHYKSIENTRSSEN